MASSGVCRLHPTILLRRSFVLPAIRATRAHAIKMALDPGGRNLHAFAPLSRFVSSFASKPSQGFSSLCLCVELAFAFPTTRTSSNVRHAHRATACSGRSASATASLDCVRTRSSGMGLKREP